MYSPQGRAIEEMHRRRFISLKRAHVPYCMAVADALKDKLGIEIADVITQRGEELRSEAISLGKPSGPLGLLWNESEGWSLRPAPSAEGKEWHAPLPVLADPALVAHWASSVLNRSASGSTEAVAKRNPTDLVMAGAEELAFEEQLDAYAQDMPAAGDRLVAVPPQSRNSAHAWDAAFRHRCLACRDFRPDTPARQWTRTMSAFLGQVVFTNDGEVITGWCLTCIPRDNAARESHWDQLLVAAHEGGRFPGSLLGSVRDLFFCSRCLDPWKAVPTAVPPLAVGLWEGTNLFIHPCPWCWREDERACRRAQRQAFARHW